MKKVVFKSSRPKGSMKIIRPDGKAKIRVIHKPGGKGVKHV